MTSPGRGRRQAHRHHHPRRLDLDRPRRLDQQARRVRARRTSRSTSRTRHRRCAGSRGPRGQHIELGISEMNLFLLLGQLGLAYELQDEQLLPVGTVYDPFVCRGLDALIYGTYSGASFVFAGTPSGVSLSREGGAHQSRDHAVDRRRAARPRASTSRASRSRRSGSCSRRSAACATASTASRRTCGSRRRRSSQAPFLDCSRGWAATRRGPACCRAPTGWPRRRDGLDRLALRDRDAAARWCPRRCGARPAGGGGHRRGDRLRDVARPRLPRARERVRRAAAGRAPSTCSTG